MAFYKLGDVFKWFIARVVDIDDEDQLGRIKIRVIHDQTGELGSKSGKLGGITDEDLLWAWPLSSIQSASLHHTKIKELEGFDVPDWIDAVGLSPTGIAVGSYVFGFYLDGHEKNIPLVFSTYHKMSVYPEPPTDGTGSMLQIPIEGDHATTEYNDVAKLARGENTLPKTVFSLGTVVEPQSAYRAQYPYNLTYTTKSGHAIEIDDTPGNERIHVYHKSGSYEEIDQSGRRVLKSTNDSYDIGENNHYFAYRVDQTGEVGRNQLINIGVNQEITIGSNQIVNIGNDCTVRIGRNCTIIVAGDADINVSGDTSIITGGSMELQSGGSMNITAGGTMNISAPTINVN